MRIQKVIVINGKPRSGKDTVVTLTKENLKGKIEVINIDTVGPVKEAMKVLGWDGETKTDEWRNFASYMKEKSDNLFNTSYKHVCLSLQKMSGKQYIAFIHCREPQNIQQLVDGLGAITLFVDRDVEVSASNFSDKHVKDFKYDFIINNNGNLEELDSEVKIFIEALKNKN